MRNLKRVLSLALALVMVLGMMVITTSAADYTDVEEITYTEAVDVMSGLEVFEGMEAADGTFYFDPDGGLTREQAATLMARIHSKGLVENLVATKQIFDDVATTRWSAKYIEYCYNCGLIDGLGDGTFAPEGELTGIAFAKLLLVAMGYDADAQGYVGKNWATSIAVDALNAGLYIDGVDITKALNREQAAQMLFQALEQDTVAYNTYFDKATGAPVLGGFYADGNTFMGEYFPTLAKVEGIITDTNSKEGTTTLTHEVTTTTTTWWGKEVTTTKKVDVPLSNTDADWTNVGYAARAWYLDGKKADTALSLVVTGEDLYVYTDGTTVAKLTSEKLGNKPNPAYVADAITGYATVCNGVYGAGIVEKIGAQNALVDNDGDGVVDTVVCTTYNVAKVTNVTKISKSGVVTDYSYTLDTTIAADKTVTPAELANVDSLKKFSTIAYTVVDGMYYVTELEAAEGEFEYIDRVELTTETAKSYSIDGVEYVKSQMDGVKTVNKAGDDLLARSNINEDVVYVVDMYGYLVRVEEPKADPDSYLYVFDNEHDSVLTGLAETKVAYIDGSVEIVDVKQDVYDSELKNEVHTYEVKNGAYVLGDAEYTTLENVAYKTYEVSMTGISDLTSTVIVDLRDVIAGKAEDGTIYVGYTEIPSFEKGTLLYIPEIDLGFLVAGKDLASAANLSASFVVFNTAANIVDRINVGTAFAPVYENTYELKAGVLVEGGLVDDYILSQYQKSMIDTYGVGVYTFAKDGTLASYVSFAENTDVQWTPESNGTIVYKNVDVVAAGTYDIIILDISKGEIGEWEQLVDAGNYYSWIDTDNKIMYVVGDDEASYTYKKADGTTGTYTSDILAVAGKVDKDLKAIDYAVVQNGLKEYTVMDNHVTAVVALEAPVVATYTVNEVLKYTVGADVSVEGYGEYVAIKTFKNGKWEIIDHAPVVDGVASFKMPACNVVTEGGYYNYFLNGVEKYIHSDELGFQGKAAWTSLDKLAGTVAADTFVKVEWTDNTGDKVATFADTAVATTPIDVVNYDEYITTNWVSVTGVPGYDYVQIGDEIVIENDYPEYAVDVTVTGADIATARLNVGETETVVAKSNVTVEMIPVTAGTPIVVTNAKGLIDAVAAAKGGETIHLEEGVYELSSVLVIRKSMTIVGLGDVTIKGTMKGTQPLITVNDGTNHEGNLVVTMSNLTLDGNSNGRADLNVKYNSTVNLHNVTIVEELLLDNGNLFTDGKAYDGVTTTVNAYNVSAAEVWMTALPRSESSHINGYHDNDTYAVLNYDEHCEFTKAPVAQDVNGNPSHVIINKI